MLKPYINHQFNGSIWRLEIDPITETLFLEIRNQADKKVYFASINLINCETYLDDLVTEERWLTGIEAAYDGKLLLHNYQSESRPEHKGLIAVDAFTGKTVWSNYVFAFDHLSFNGPVVYDTRIQPRKLFLADINTGATIRLYEPSIDLEPDNNLIFPQEVATDFLPDLQLPISPFGNTVHYLDHNNYRIVSLHSLVEEVLKQHLFIMDKDGIVYTDLLNHNIQKLQPESFLLYKNRLMYLKNKSEIKVLNL